MFIMFEDSFGAAIFIESAFVQIVTVSPPLNKDNTTDRSGCWTVNITNPAHERNVPYHSLYYKEKKDAFAVYTRLCEITQK